MANKEKLDFQVVHDKFQAALVEAEEDAILKAYIEGYEELYKFLTLMGTIFSFVSKDLVSKMEIMNELLSQNPEEFQTVKKMIEYEKQKELLTKKGYVSGSRTLLRLHRGLNFIREFLRGVHEIEDQVSTAHVCKTAYEGTLAKYHPFIIRNGARVAMNVMPTRGQLFKKVIGEDPKEVELVIQLMPNVLCVLGNVFDRVEFLYTSYELHDLP